MLNLCKEFDKAKFPMNEMSQINSAQFKVEMGRSCVKNDAMFLFCTWTNYWNKSTSKISVAYAEKMINWIEDSWKWAYCIIINEN